MTVIDSGKTEHSLQINLQGNSWGFFCAFLLPLTYGKETNKNGTHKEVRQDFQ